MSEFVGPHVYVVVAAAHRDQVDAFRNAGLNAHTQQLPFGMELPKHITELPQELIQVGGSVSADFAIAAILLARQLFPELKYVFLSADRKEHYATPEDTHYLVVLHCLTEQAEEYGCKPWSDDDFDQLKLIANQSDFHYFVRSFYQKSMIIDRSNLTLVKYFGGIHDGETLQMEEPPEGLVKLGDLLGHINRQDGSGFDVYRPKINGDVLEFYFERTHRN